MFWFIMYVIVNESTHREHACFQGLNFVPRFTFKKYNFSSCSRFGAHIVSTVILTSYERTHKATTRQIVWNRFYWQSKSEPPFAHLLAKCDEGYYKSETNVLIQCRTIVYQPDFVIPQSARDLVSADTRSSIWGCTETWSSPDQHTQATCEGLCTRPQSIEEQSVGAVQT